MNETSNAGDRPSPIAVISAIPKLLITAKPGTFLARSLCFHLSPFQAIHQEWKVVQHQKLQSSRVPGL
jgi:hypothetical protein